MNLAHSKLYVSSIERDLNFLKSVLEGAVCFASSRDGKEKRYMIYYVGKRDYIYT